MILSEYIAKLQEIEKTEGGDLQVVGLRFKKGPPRIEYQYNKYRVMENPIDGFWSEGFDPISTRGDKVVLIP